MERERHGTGMRQSAGCSGPGLALTSVPPLLPACACVCVCQGVETPAEYEGGGMTFTQSCIVIEELAKVDPAISGQTQNQCPL